MKYTKYNSPEKLYERFQRVNKVKIDESVIDTVSLDTKLMEYYNLLKQNQLKVDSINTSVSGDESFVELVCSDDAGNTITFNFKSRFDEGDMDGVFGLVDGEMIGFSFNSNDDITNVEIDENGLKSFNERFSNEIVDIISDFVDVENNQPEEALYNEAVKKIDERTFKPLSLNESFVYFDKLPDDKKKYYLDLGKEVVFNELKKHNFDPSWLTHDDMTIRVVKAANDIYTQDLTYMNEDYPDPIVKNFATKKSDPFKEKRSSKKTMVVNEINTDTVPGYANIDLPQDDFDYDPINVGDEDMESKLLGYKPIREGEDGEHCVIFDGTSAYIGPSSDAEDEIAAGNEILGYFDDIDAAQEYADEVNREAYQGYIK